MIMKRIFHVLFTCVIGLLVLGCQSNEKKAAALIDDYMYKNLHDYKSYEPIETKMDSMFMSPRTNVDIIVEAIKADVMEGISDEHHKAYERAKSTMNIWSGGWSSTSRSEYKKAQKESAQELTESIDASIKQFEHMMRITELSDLLSTEKDFIGWNIVHRFRSKNQAGNSTVSTYVFWANKDFSDFLLPVFDGEDYEDFIKIIDDANMMGKDFFAGEIEEMEEAKKKIEPLTK